MITRSERGLPKKGSGILLQQEAYGVDIDIKDAVIYDDHNDFHIISKMHDWNDDVCENDERLMLEIAETVPKVTRYAARMDIVSAALTR